jgi:hypothetical protein
VPIPDSSSRQYSDSLSRFRFGPRRAINTPFIYQVCCDKYWNPPVAQGSKFGRR